MRKSFVKTVVTLGVGMIIGSATLAAAAPSTIQAVISNFKVVVNNEQANLKNAPIVSDGVTYLPIREVAGLLDADVKYDAKNKQINLDSKGDNAVVTETEQEWVFLRDIASKYSLKVQQQKSGSHDLFDVKSGENVLFTVDSTKLEQGYIAYTEDGHPISVKINSGNQIQISATDLKDAGIIQ